MASPCSRRTVRKSLARAQLDRSQATSGESHDLNNVAVFPPAPAQAFAHQISATMHKLFAGLRDAYRLAGNEKARIEFQGGKDSAINAMKGPVIKASRGKANPKLVDETLRRLLAVS